MQSLLDQAKNFMPHGHCYFWLPPILWMHVISDAIIALAYMSIPFALFSFVKRRTDLEFKWVFRLFAAFILLCGLTHMLSIWVIWKPDYLQEGVVKAMTALVSIATAALLWPLIPRTLALPSPAMLRQSNEELLAEIERRKRAEVALGETNRRLQERLEEIESFSYAVSHDLRAPIRTINGFSSLLLQDQDTRLGDGARDSLQRIIAATTRMSSLIDGLLALAGLSNETETYIELDMRQLAHTAAEAAQREHPGARLEIRDLPPAIGDRTTVTQIWANLLDNAFKFSARTPDACVLVDFERGAEGEVVYVVKDNGAGFDPQFAQRIFGIFQRMHHVSEFKGTGIGLAGQAHHRAPSRARFGRIDPGQWHHGALQPECGCG
jgi:signal transduction histidine kinase